MHTSFPLVFTPSCYGNLTASAFIFLRVKMYTHCSRDYSFHDNCHRADEWHINLSLVPQTFFHVPEFFFFLKNLEQVSKPATSKLIWKMKQENFRVSEAQALGASFPEL